MRAFPRVIIENVDEKRDAQSARIVRSWALLHFEIDSAVNFPREKVVITNDEKKNCQNSEIKCAGLHFSSRTMDRKSFVSEIYPSWIDRKFVPISMLVHYFLAWPERDHCTNGRNTDENKCNRTTKDTSIRSIEFDWKKYLRREGRFAFLHKLSDRNLRLFAWNWNKEGRRRRSTARGGKEFFSMGEGEGGKASSVT